ncbi:MAG: hypothetical protein ACJ8DZ_03535 [Allosphingosinicella sp.]
MKKSRLAGLGSLLLVGACASGQEAKPVRAEAAPPPRYNPLGLENVIGRTAHYLENQFGKADLDVREGSARKLQFSGPACVLDAYLYPPRGGGDPIVTYVDARRPDGTDFDRASCAAALVKKAE